MVAIKTACGCFSGHTILRLRLAHYKEICGKAIGPKQGSRLGQHLTSCGMQFTADQLATMVGAFSGLMDDRVRTTLPLILEEWGRVDLSEHLARKTPEQLRKEQRQLEQVANLARELRDALAGLAAAARFTLASRLDATARAPKAEAASNHEVQSAGTLRHLERRQLECLAQAAGATAGGWVPLPFRHTTVIQYLVLQDLAAIYEYVTGEIASRRVRGEDHPEAGRDYGPFWDFAVVAWRIIFGSNKGLSAALKRWAEARHRYDEASPVIANLALHHPEWRIYED